MSSPTISVIISTCNRAEALAGALEALCSQRGAVFEVVVVNGPSEDNTKQVLTRWADRIKVAACPVRNIPVSRNIGLETTAGELVVFIDDDGRPVDEHWLQRYAEAFNNDETGHIGAWGGPVRHMDSQNAEFDGGMMSDYGFMFFHPDWPRPPQGRHWRAMVCGCNMAFSRHALLAIGGFDERYTYYAEEADACRRLHTNGLEVIRLPGNAVRHYPDRLKRQNHPLDRDWQIVSRSDTLFAMRHGQDPYAKRLLKTIFFAWQKHYVVELRQARVADEMPFTLWCRCMVRVARGVASGLWLSLAIHPRPRRFREPPAFKPFMEADT